MGHKIKLLPSPDRLPWYPALQSATAGEEKFIPASIQRRSKPSCSLLNLGRSVSAGVPKGWLHSHALQFAYVISRTSHVRFPCRRGPKIVREERKATRTAREHFFVEKKHVVGQKSYLCRGSNCPHDSADHDRRPCPILPLSRRSKFVRAHRQAEVSTGQRSSCIGELRESEVSGVHTRNRNSEYLLAVNLRAGPYEISLAASCCQAKHPVAWS